ncbi:MAG: hypothetical protein ACP5RP_04570, partial [Candidatus Micrarchaeia archaeon]
ELLNLKISDLDLSGELAHITVVGKTGSRKILKEYWKKLDGLEVIEINVQNNGLLQNINKIKK